MRSPFKFLDAFTLHDREVFFGREQEIDRLYSMVFQSPLSMVYGLSGTGKTSLIQCGLASRFDGPDWFPFFIRRGTDINLSLHEALNFYLDEDETQMSLIGKVSFLYGEYLSPVYLIFDQFEELFILGTKKEQDIFLESIRALLDADLACRIILVMREEYLGHLYDFEQLIPNIFDFRLRVERMNSTRIKQVMDASFGKFNIALEPPKEDRLQQMVENISGEKFGIQLPYLQVYLDLLYRRDHERTYGKTGNEKVLPPLTFTEKEIEQLGKIENVLEQFVREQQQGLQSNLTTQYPNFPREGVSRILDAFVTGEGTKRPVFYERKNGVIIPSEKFSELLPKIVPNTLSDAIAGLEQRRILRFTDSTIELAHDSIAALIDESRTEQQRQLNQILRRIKNSYIEYRDSQVYLNEKQLNVIDEYLPLLELEKPIEDFIEKSRTEAIRQRKFIEERKQAALRKKLLPIIAALAIIAVVAGVFAFIQMKEAIAAKKSVEKNEILSDISNSETQMRQGIYQGAEQNLNIAEQKIKNRELQNEMEKELKQISLRRNNYRQLGLLMSRGDTLLKTEDLSDTLKVEALKSYKEAFSIEADSLISSKIQGLELLIQQSAETWYNRLQIYKQYGQKNNYVSAAQDYFDKLNNVLPEKLKVKIEEE